MDVKETIKDRVSDDVVAKEVFRLIDELGYQIVPVEPTEAMLNAPAELFMLNDPFTVGKRMAAYHFIKYSPVNRTSMYKAMLQAAKEEDNDG